MIYTPSEAIRQLVAQGFAVVAASDGRRLTSDELDDALYVLDEDALIERLRLRAPAGIDPTRGQRSIRDSVRVALAARSRDAAAQRERALRRWRPWGA